MEASVSFTDGSGAALLSFEGTGSGTATVSADTNEGIDREASILFRTTPGTLSLQRTIRQEGLRETFDVAEGSLLLADGGTFNILKQQP